MIFWLRFYQMQVQKRKGALSDTLSSMLASLISASRSTPNSQSCPSRCPNHSVRRSLKIRMIPKSRSFHRSTLMNQRSRSFRRSTRTNPRSRLDHRCFRKNPRIPCSDPGFQSASQNPAGFRIPWIRCLRRNRCCFRRSNYLTNRFGCCCHFHLHSVLLHSIQLMRSADSDSSSVPCCSLPCCYPPKELYAFTVRCNGNACAIFHFG
jgi:hypothetical protein